MVGNARRTVNLQEGSARDLHLKPPGLHTCGWHLYVSEKDEWKRGSYKDNNGELLASMEQWTKLPAAKQKPYLDKAKKHRLEAKNQGSALDRALSHDFEECGGPWRLSASVTKRQADSSDGLPPKRRPAEWPIARVHIEREMDGMRLKQAWEHWQRKESKVWEEDPDFPGTVSMPEACFEGECLAVLTGAAWPSSSVGQIFALGIDERWMATRVVAMCGVQSGRAYYLCTCRKPWVNA